MEKLLVSAGFEYKVADSAEKREKLNRLPQHKLLRHSRQDKVRYLYADAAYCNCVYLGDETAYRRLQLLVNSEKLTAEQDKGIWSTDRVAQEGKSLMILEVVEVGSDVEPFIEQY
jgi:hypothetical protein